MTWLYLAIAIVCETIGTTALKATNGFNHLGFTVLSLASYSVAFYFLALVLKTMPVGVAYAIWSGAGVALVTLIGLVIFRQKLDLAAILGIALIVAGVVVLNTLSGTTRH